MSVLILAYGLLVYALFLSCFLYLAAFLSDLPVPRTIDRGGSDGPVLHAVLVDLLLRQE